MQSSLAKLIKPSRLRPNTSFLSRSQRRLKFGLKSQIRVLVSAQKIKITFSVLSSKLKTHYPNKSIRIVMG
jgi:hypothetical protein